MAKLAGIRIARFDLFVALDAGRMGGSIGPWNRFLMDDVTVTVNTSQLQFPDMHPTNNCTILGYLFHF